MAVMKTIIGATTALVVGTLSAQAGGIDRSGLPISALFEKGSYVELSFGSVSPSISGTDIAAQATGDVGADYFQFGFAYKRDINDQISYAIIVDQPFGADVLYAATSPVLGGTRAVAETVGTTVLLRYKFNDRVSVHGGLRADYASAEIDLRGAAYGAAPPAGLNGYSVAFGGDIGVGYVVGAAYEIPDIALRFALTYHSAITHDFETRENVLAGVTTTKVKTPQSVNLDFQTGIAEDTLLFGQIRWVDWTQFRVSPTAFAAATAGGSLVNLEDAVTYSLGVGRRFNETWSGSVSVSYEATGTTDLVSPLAPTDGRIGVTVGAAYTKDNMRISGGINYTELGDARPATAGAARASMTGSSVIGVGLKVGWNF